ncbi:MAG: nickel transporter [Steroidobacteraceae bacterium]
MHDLPTGGTALLALVFLMGLRHGFDADHLAAIDGLTRYNARRGRAFASRCGVLFSLGHGAIVLVVALGVGLAQRRWEVPTWFELGGAWTSIGFLTLIGAVNLRAVIVAAPREVVAPVAVKGQLLRRAMQAGHPLTVALVGALYAVSFDTVSQSVLFAVTATRFGGVALSLVVGALFVLGMVATDGLNGLWIARLIARSDRIGALASRVMGIGISVASLLTAAYGTAKLLAADVAGWGAGHEWAVGTAVIAIVALGYLAAERFAHNGVAAGRAVQDA